MHESYISTSRDFIGLYLLLIFSPCNGYDSKEYTISFRLTQIHTSIHSFLFSVLLSLLSWMCFTFSLIMAQMPQTETGHFHDSVYCFNNFVFRVVVYLEPTVFCTLCTAISNFTYECQILNKVCIFEKLIVDET